MVVLSRPKTWGGRRLVKGSAKGKRAPLFRSAAKERAGCKSLVEPRKESAVNGIVGSRKKELEVTGGGLLRAGTVAPVGEV